MEQITVAGPEELLGRLTEPELKAAPPLLYVRGDTALIEFGRRVAVVGSRRASPEGLELARRITVELVRQDVTVVSGLALGIDTVAHRTALARGGKTVAVLGTAISQYAVERNRSLQDEIGARGLLVSQFPCGGAPHRSNFPRRNRTMALLSDATVIVEAGERSGTRHQGWEALRLARPVLFPRQLKHRMPSWLGEMVQYGAFGFDRDSLRLVLEELPHRRPAIELDDHIPF